MKTAVTNPVEFAKDRFTGGIGVGVGTNTPTADFDVRGSAVFNDNGGNNDFRIEGDAQPNLFFAKASTDRIGIGTNDPNERLEIAGPNLGLFLNGSGSSPPS